MELKGIIPAMVTPLTADQKINREVTRTLINKLIDSGVHGIFTLGTNGEFHLLSEKEKLELVEIILDEVNGEVPVIVGTGGNSTEEVIQLSRKMEKIGADALSVITPYFITPSQEEVLQHYRSIAASTTLPILLYNIPARTGMNLEPETVASLSAVPNIVGIKDSSGDFNNIKRYLDVTDRNNFFVLSGTDSLILETLNAGGTGAIAATANAVPSLVVSIYDHWKNGELESAKHAQRQLEPLRDSFPLGTLPSVLKKAIELLGTPVGPPKLPVLELTGEALEKVREMVKNYQS